MDTFMNIITFIAIIGELILVGCRFFSVSAYPVHSSFVVLLWGRFLSYRPFPMDIGNVVQIEYAADVLAATHACKRFIFFLN